MKSENKEWKVRHITRGSVIERFEATRQEVMHLAEKVLVKDPEFDAELIKQLFCFKDPKERFDSLDSRMKARNVEVLIVTSPIYVQEIAGIPALVTNRHCMAIYYRDHHTITLVEKGTNTIEKILTNLICEHPNYMIAIEKQDPTLDDHVCTGILDHLKQVTFWTSDLSTWCSELSSLEVPYTVLIGKITVGAIEKTLQKVKSDWQEGKVKNKKEIAAILHENYMVIFRSVSGNNPLNFIVKPLIKQIDLDSSNSTDFVLTIEAGALLVEDDGIIRAVTNVSRSLSFNLKYETVYRLLQDIVSDDMALSCFTNARGRDVYMACINALEKRKQERRNVGVIPEPATLLEGNNDYAGYLLCKQPLWEEAEAFHEKSSFILDSGVSGTIELSYRNLVGTCKYGDMFIAHPLKGLNLTNYHPF